MKKLFTLLFCMMGALVTMSAQGKLTPNEQQARRLFDEAYNMVYGPKGSQLTYSVNIIGIYKTTTVHENPLTFWQNAIFSTV
jgi:hypothetical protein